MLLQHFDFFVSMIDIWQNRFVPRRNKKCYLVVRRRVSSYDRDWWKTGVRRSMTKLCSIKTNCWSLTKPGMFNIWSRKSSLVVFVQDISIIFFSYVKSKKGQIYNWWKSIWIKDINHLFSFVISCVGLCFIIETFCSNTSAFKDRVHHIIIGLNLPLKIAKKMICLPANEI